MLEIFEKRCYIQFCLMHNYKFILCIYGEKKS